MQAGELFRNGSKVKLQGQPFEILAVMLEHPGRLVTREELRGRLWPSDTFVDFEHGLNAAVNRLREALSDSADQPRFIETVPRRGYRFIQPTQGFIDADTVVGEPPVRRLKTRRVGLRYATVLAVALALFIGVAVRRYVSLNASKSPALPMTPVPFTSFPGIEDGPSFSPNGSQIAFRWDGEKEDNYDIYVKMIGAEKPLRLTSNPGADRNPVWSPDGRFIAFHRHTENEDGIFVVPATGGRERKLRSLRLGGEWYFESLDWSPDGKSLVFSDRPSDDGGAGTFLLSVENPEYNRRLTSATALDVPDFNLRFSPDGKTVAFVRSLTLGSSNEIFIVSVAGGEPKRLTFDKTSIGGLTWTPDGTYIIFFSDRLGGGPRLWKIRTSGGDPEPLSVGQEGASQPTLSRDGRRLAYTRSVGDTNIWRYAIPQPAKRSELPTRLIASTQEDQAPHFSPDGKRIVFSSTRSGSDEIWVCDSDGSNPLQLTMLHGSMAGTPRWSPDGQQIAFDFEPEGNVDIYVMKTDVGRPRRLTPDSSNDFAPTWSTDGQWIYFTSNRSGTNQIWKLPAQGGRALQITKNGGQSPAYESRDGKSLYYSKGFMVPGVWNVPLGGGEETPVLDHPAGGFYGYWDLVEEGIYYYNKDTKDIEFFDFATKHVKRVATPLKPPIMNNPGFAVSPDQRWILFAQYDRFNVDIMLVENFHW